jgi:hypothetical protein
MYVQLSRRGVVVLGTLIVVGCGSVGCGSGNSSASARSEDRPATQAGAQKVNPDAQLLADFKSRIDNYMELHNRLEKQAPPLKETKDPAQIKASQDGLAQKIREARKDAKPGEIFTPEIRQLFRRLMYPETKGTDGAETKAAIAEEKQELKDVKIRVNASYPDDAPLMTVPPNILAALPKLPEDLEFRFVSKHMILLDVHANLIVDYVLNAIQ